MSPTREETDKLLDDIERFANRKLRYRPEISSLIELAISQHQKSIFGDMVFLAKFLWNSHNVMQRIGPTDEGYPKLSAEFHDSLEKFSTLMKTLVKDSPVDVWESSEGVLRRSPFGHSDIPSGKEQFTSTFFSMSQESMNNLIQLSSELSWLKNYSIDTKKSIL